MTGKLLLEKVRSGQRKKNKWEEEGKFSTVNGKEAQGASGARTEESPHRVQALLKPALGVAKLIGFVVLT